MLNQQVMIFLWRLWWSGLKPRVCGLVSGAAEGEAQAGIGSMPFSPHMGFWVCQHLLSIRVQNAGAEERVPIDEQVTEPPELSGSGSLLAFPVSQCGHFSLPRYRMPALSLLRLWSSSILLIKLLPVSDHEPVTGVIAL